MPAPGRLSQSSIFRTLDDEFKPSISIKLDEATTVANSSEKERKRKDFIIWVISFV